MPVVLKTFREALSVKWDLLVTQGGKRFFYESAETLLTTLITEMLLHDTTFHSKHELLIHYHTQPLLHDILGTFYDFSTSATPVLVPID